MVLCGAAEPIRSVNFGMKIHTTGLYALGLIICQQAYSDYLSMLVMLIHSLALMLVGTASPSAV